MERKTLREWVANIGSSGLMDVIATKFSTETWESKFDLEGASKVLDDVLSDLNLRPFTATIKETRPLSAVIAREEKAGSGKRSSRPKRGETRRRRIPGKPHR